MLRRLGLRRMSSRTEKEPKSLLDLLDVLKIWELSKQGIAAWAVAGTIGYVLYIRPKMYPKIEYEQARTFTDLSSGGVPAALSPRAARCSTRIIRSIQCSSTMAVVVPRDTR